MSKFALMRERLVLERSVGTPDGAGGHMYEWTPVASLWGEVIPLSGSRMRAFDRMNNLVSYRVHLRFRCDVRPGMRLLWGDRLLDVQAAFDPDGRRHILECLCQECVS